MRKIFIRLDEREQLLLERIRVDEDPQEALDFLLQTLVPKIQEASRSERERSRQEGD